MHLVQAFRKALSIDAFQQRARVLGYKERTESQLDAAVA